MCNVSLYSIALGWDLRADPMDTGFHRHHEMPVAQMHFMVGALVLIP